MTARWLRQLSVMLGKELRQLARDRVLFAFIVWIFTGNIWLAAGEEGTELRLARLLVHDADHSAASRELLHRFRPPYFRLGGEVVRVEDGARALDRGGATLLLVIPPRFDAALREGEPTAVQILVDATHASTGYLAASYGVRITARFAEDHAAGWLARQPLAWGPLPAVEHRPRIWFNPVLDEAWFATISELLTMITVACVLLPAAALVREKERGTIEQLLVSPLTPTQVLLGKTIAMTLITLAGTAVAYFGIMRPFFSVPARGSLLLFFGLTAVYAFTASGLGLVAATFTRRTGQVGMLALLIVMPLVMLSGIRTPWESMPGWLRSVMSLSPLHHLIEIAYGILLRGAGLAVLWDHVLAMAGLGALLFTAGVWRFRRQFE
jgi:ABC-2 type transport system permease protein